MADRTTAVRAPGFRDDVLTASKDKLTKFMGGTVTPNLLVVLVDIVADAVVDALAERDAKPHGGWARGNYQNKCCLCGVMFMGDKRAVTCLRCADAAEKG